MTTELTPQGSCLKKPRSSFSKAFGILLFSILSFGASISTKACLALDVPVLVTQTISNGNLLLDWQSVNVWACNGYSVEVEIACDGQNFTGNGPFLYSPNLNKTVVTPMAYPQQTISMSQFCPGKVYKFRAREVYFASFSNWTADFTFTVPGVYVPPTLNVSASNYVVCPPNTPTLNAAVSNPCGNVTYAWTPTLGLSSATVASPVASPTVNTLYTVVTSGGPLSCWVLTGTVQIDINIPDPPAVGPASANPSIVCIGKTTTLQVTNFTGNLVWQAGANGSGPWTNIGSTGTLVTQPLQQTTCFRALVSSCGGTVTSNIVCVNANSNPTLSPNVIQSTCANTLAAVNLNNPGSSGNPITATWTPAPVAFGPQSTTATYLTPGVVSVTLNFSDGCVSTTQFTVNPPPPTPIFTIMNVTGSESITCINPVVTLNAATNYTFGNLNYNWTSASSNSTTQQIDVANPATYTVTLIDPATNCSSTQTTAIYLNITAPQSNVTPVNSNLLCGQNAVLTATGTAISPTINVTHCWFAPDLNGLVIPPVCGGGNISINGLGQVGTYTYVLTNNVNGCTTTKTLQVTSNLGFPTFSLSSVANFTMGCSTKSITDVHIIQPNTVPSGGAVSFTVLPPGFSSPGYTYNAVLDYSFTVPGNYTVIVRDDNNQCETRVTLPLIQDVFPPNIGVAAPIRTLTCFTPSVILQGVSSTTPVTYQWAFQNNGNPNTVPSSTITTQTTTNTAITGTVVNIYTLTVTNTNNLCTSNSLVPMYQNIRPPLPKINGAGPIDCINSFQTLANGSSLNEAPGFFAPLGTAAVKWQGPSPQVDADTVAFYVAKTVGIYTMNVMDRNNGCVTFTTVQVADRRNYPVIISDGTFVIDCGNPSYKLQPLFTPSTGLTYRWDSEPGVAISNPTLSSLSVSAPGGYQITATDISTGCRTGKMLNVGNGMLTGNFEADSYNGFAPMTVNFTNLSASSSTVSGTSSVTTVWSFGNGTTRTTTTNIPTSATYQQPGTYTVTAFTSKGACLDTIVKVIVVDIPSKLVVPNVFTPNGDNSNDVFFIKAANLSEITAIIYDRWGNKVYELTTDKGNIAWDGKNMSGKDAPDGTYFYIITAKGKDGLSYDTKGNVSLYR